jgi:RNA recognition motif-containing protein
MTKKLFVGGLSWELTESQLQEAFSAFGEVNEVKIITDRDTGRPRGFGFVTFADSAEADAAIAKMNGTEFAGRTINVNEARERTPRGGR